MKEDAEFGYSNNDLVIILSAIDKCGVIEDQDMCELIGKYYTCTTKYIYNVFASNKTV